MPNPKTEDEVLAVYREVDDDMDILSEGEYEQIIAEDCLATTIIPIDPFDELTELLHAWGHLELLEHFKRNDIDVEVLRNLECHHLAQLLKPFKYRTLIMFESKLKEWRDSIGKPLFMYSKSEFGPFRNIFSMSEPSSPYQVPTRPNVPTTPSTPKTSQELPSLISLGKILNSTSLSKSLVESYEKNSKFTEKQRTHLINTIASYFDLNQIHLDLHSSYALEKEIIERFPTERLEYYRTGKRGKMYNKFCNLKFSHKNIGTTSKPKTSTIETTDEEMFLVPEDDVDQIIRSLKYDNLSGEALDRMWKACTNHRILSIKDSENTSQIFLKWPQYKCPTGHRMIEMDFSYLHPNAGSLLENWEELKPLILKFLLSENHVKERNIIDALNKLLPNQTGICAVPDKCQDAVLLWALHGYFVPFQKIVKKEMDGKKTITRFTIKDSQNSFVWVGKTVQEIEEHIASFQKSSEKIQPFIIVHGDSIFNFKDIFLYFDGVKLIFTSFLRAVDICFKIFFLFNLCYPVPSSSFWGFIETQYFKKNKKKINTKTYILLNELNTLKTS